MNVVMATLGEMKAAVFPVLAIDTLSPGRAELRVPVEVNVAVVLPSYVLSATVTPDTVNASGLIFAVTVGNVRL